MSKVVLIGSSSAIAKSLQENSNREFVCFTRSNGFDVSGDLLELDSLDNLSSLSSTTSTIPMFGSIVQKGKFAASAFFEAVSALNKVDFPTLGSPTIPHLNPIKILINFA